MASRAAAMSEALSSTTSSWCARGERGRRRSRDALPPLGDELVLPVDDLEHVEAGVCGLAMAREPEGAAKDRVGDAGLPDCGEHLRAGCGSGGARCLHRSQ